MTRALTIEGNLKFERRAKGVKRAVKRAGDSNPKVIRPSQLKIMTYLTEVGECTIRDYRSAQGQTESKVPFVTVSNDFRALRKSGLVNVEKRGTVMVYKSALTSRQFRHWCARYIIEHAFGGSLELLLETLDEIIAQKRRSA